MGPTRENLVLNPLAVIFFVCVISSLHLSLWSAAWVTFNEAGSNRSCFLLQLFFLECFMSIFLASHFSLSFFNPHPSNRVSFSHLTSLRSSLVSRALARLWSFTGEPVFPFPIRSDKIARVGGGIRSRVLPKECRPFFPKTTVSWPLAVLSLNNQL